jgi:hypothetical protein
MRVPVDTHDRLIKIAVRHDLSVNELLRRVIIRAFNDDTDNADSLPRLQT